MTHALKQLKVTLVTALLALSATQAIAGGGSDEKKLWEAERTWVRALETADVKLLEQLVDDELTFIGPDGEYEDRAAYLAGYRAMASMGVKVKKIELHDVKPRVLGDTGVVTGRVVARIEVQGKPVVENVRFTRVYQRRGDRFRMVAGQGTRHPPITGAAAAQPPG